MLERYLQGKRWTKDILIMSHIIVGYPSFEVCHRMIEVMVEAGTDLMELQVPFSEPLADGPVILRANQKALENGASVRDCLRFVREVTGRFDIPFILVSYYNIFLRHGLPEFIAAISEAGVEGAIVPDLPPEEGQDYLESMRNKQLAPIWLFSPATPLSRMKYISSLARGFVYCVARKGVTGAQTVFSEKMIRYLGSCRRATKLPLAVGFGITGKPDVDFLKNRAEIAVVGTQTVKLVQERGVGAVGDFVHSLR